MAKGLEEEKSLQLTKSFLTNNFWRYDITTHELEDKTLDRQRLRLCPNASDGIRSFANVVFKR
jgi:hypothetical protein